MYYTINYLKPHMYLGIAEYVLGLFSFEIWKLKTHKCHYEAQKLDKNLMFKIIFIFRVVYLCNFKILMGYVLGRIWCYDVINSHNIMVIGKNTRGKNNHGKNTRWKIPDRKNTCGNKNLMEKIPVEKIPSGKNTRWKKYPWK